MYDQFVPFIKNNCINTRWQMGTYCNDTKGNEELVQIKRALTNTMALVTE